MVGDADLAVNLLAEAKVAFIYPIVVDRGFGTDDALPGRYGVLPRSNFPLLVRLLVCASFGSFS